MAVFLIIVIVGLAGVSIAAVWNVIEVRDVVYKAFFSFAILASAYAIIVTAAHYWELRDGSESGPPAGGFGPHS